jgi:hypothetical protein
MKYDCDVTVRKIGSVIKFIEEKDNASDNTFVSTAVIRKLLGGSRTSELFGPEGLFAATMKCVDAITVIEDLVNDPMPARDRADFIKRVISGKPVDRFGYAE